MAQFLLEERNRGSERQVEGFANETMRKFREYNWPGNAAELQAVIDEAYEACETTHIVCQDLPFRFRTGMDAQLEGPPLTADPAPLELTLRQVEEEQIRKALEQAGGNRSQAARLLSLSRTALYRRMESPGISN